MITVSDRFCQIECASKPTSFISVSHTRLILEIQCHDFVLTTLVIHDSFTERMNRIGTNFFLSQILSNVSDLVRTDQHAMFVMHEFVLLSLFIIVY